METKMKTISKPGRTSEIFPQTLMKTPMKNKTGNRGKYRSSPRMIFRRKTSSSTNDEPSSPKVTCIGQVRNRRRRSKPIPVRRKVKVVFYGRGLGKRIRTWMKWPFLSIWSCFGRKKNDKDVSMSLEMENETEERTPMKGEDVSDDQSLSSPPKNALFLMRKGSTSLMSRYFENSETEDLNSSEKTKAAAAEEVNEERGGEEIVQQPFITARSEIEPARMVEKMSPKGR
ncbi:uncharacterized protein LOC124935619 [Impatiens glandulifera]|uniref:uncharacterized protein LOC124935619 n=1 Tax=Impatiens glandulifera TaxID=253017 RepID=UPI001FB054AF|nr:uncharacterized protein LOC124935619 [Impatiens glandulifera]